ncbi:MAG TPA: ABC transporter permease [Bryobacteraceae bacterium]|nr:ABC transporter permease [Bryobacteraceae bacterium]
MGSFLSDLRHSIRLLIKTPGFTAIAIAALALGIGANTAIFSVVNTVLLQPLPYAAPERIMRIHRTFPQGAGDSVSIPKYMAWKKDNQAFEAMAIYDFSGPGLNLGSGDHPEQVKGIHVSAEYFQVFGVKLAQGRTFLPQEDLPGGPKTAIVSYNLWQTRLGGDPALVGKPLVLGGDPYTVIGILPPTFQSDPPADVFIPLQADPNSINQGNYLLVAGRLKPGLTIASANANMKIAGERFRDANPKWMDKTEGVGVMPLRDALVGDVRLPLLILTGAVGFVLLIACANVANLLLARAAARQKEIAIRTAIGATRGRLVRQLLTESVLLATISGALGFVIGAWGVRVLLALSPGNLPRINDQTHAGSMISVLDWHVLAFTFGVALLTGILFGLFPAVHISRMDVNSALKETSGRSGTGLRQNRARSLLVIGEMALAVILLAGAALMIRTFVGLRSVQSGFDPHNVITMQTSLTGGRYDSTAKAANMITQVLQRVNALPGVQVAAATVMLPLEGGVDFPFVIEGQPPAKGGIYNGDEQWRFVSPGYFNAFRIPLLRGRQFDDRDNGKSERVLIINQAMAKKYWPSGDPIGSRLSIGKGLGPDFEEPIRQIVGIVGNVRETGLSDSDQAVMYVPEAQITDPLTRLANSVVPLSWAIRTANDPSSLVAPIQREFLAVDGQLPVSKVRTMEQVVSESTARQNFNMLLLTIFAALALTLAAIGIYGLMSYTVEQRMQEIGIRLALGAGARDMLSMIVRQGMLLAGIGLAIGLGAAYGLTRLLASLLFGVKTTDPITYGAVAVVLTAVALLACYIPARRATRIDPLIALRYE